MRLRGKLMGVLLAVGLVPAGAIGYAAYSATDATIAGVADGYVAAAQELADKIDRSLFERYGDVQAFTLNRVIAEPEQWASASKRGEIVRVMNAYVDTYDVYYLSMLVDAAGRVVAINSADSDGKPIETAGLLGRSFADAAWFKDAVAGRFHASPEGGITGTVVEDVHANELVRAVYGDEGLALGFSAPVKDEQGRVIGVWRNLAKFSLVEEIFQSTYGSLAARGYSSAELTLLRRDGTVLIDYDPVLAGSDQIRRDPAVVGKLNLVDKGLESAIRLSRGETGSAPSQRHARKGTLQTAGYATFKGAMGLRPLPWGVLVRVDDQQALAGPYAIRTRIAVALSVSAVVIVAVGLWFSGALVKPVHLMVARLKDIAEGEGDLTQRVDEQRKDELGELGRWFNVFVGKIQQLMKDVADASKQVAAASTQIAASSEQMASGLHQQQDQTQQVSASVEEMSRSVADAAQKSADAAKAALNSGQRASDGGEVVHQTVAEINAIAVEVRQASGAVSDLGKKSEQIGQIIGVINDIADQTNLLALNAAIEAARAGEHGRGFAVVADEVRKLAERTTQATEEVARSIRQIQEQTTAAVRTIDAGSGRVARGVELAGRAGESLEQIVGASNAVHAMVQSIAAATHEQSAAGEQIARSIERISAVARESHEGAGQAARAAADLSCQAESLRSLVARFKL
jgi:methyl-accepting chemotaxis protein